MVDIRYITGGVLDASLDINHAFRNDSLTQAIKDILEIHLKKIESKSSSFKKLELDSIANDFFFYRILSKVYRDIPLTKGNGRLPNYFEKIENKFKSSTPDMYPIDYRGTAIFVYIFDIYNEDENGFDRLRFLFNSDPNTPAGAIVPYLEGYVVLYNFNSQDVEYYYQISNDGVDLYNSYQSGMKILLEEITKGYRLINPKSNHQ